MYFFKRLIFIVILISSAIILLTTHIDDGNVWSIIYIKNNMLFIGDFWLAILVMALFIEAYIQIRAIISYMLGLSEKEK
jgi:hypothetical protein